MGKKFSKIVLMASILIGSYCGWNLWNVHIENETRQEQISELQEAVLNPVTDQDMKVEWDLIQATNPEIVAWVYMPYADISYPVVQSTDNERYLNQNFTGAYDRYGTPFLDSMASGNFTSDNSLIYAHSAAEGGMFTNLKEFQDEAFFDAHPYFYLLTPTVNWKVDIKAFAAVPYTIDYYNTSFYDKQLIVDDLLARSIWIRPELDVNTGTMISLSTCNLAYGYESDQRFLLTGVKTPVESVPVSF